MDKCNEVFDDDISNVINMLRNSLHTFKNLEISNNVLEQKNKILTEELQSINNNKSSSNQDDILKEISQNLRINGTIINERLNNLQAELKVAIQLNRKYKNDIDTMEEKYINEIQTLNEENAKEINRLKTEFENKMETMNSNSILSNEDHIMRIEELKAQKNTKIMEMKLEHIDTVEEYERAIEKLNEKIFEITTLYDKMKEKCDNLEKKLSTFRENSAKSWSAHDNEIFANKTIHPKSFEKTIKSNIEPSFTTKITKPNDEANKLVEVATKKPKKRKLFNPRSEIIFLNDQ